VNATRATRTTITRSRPFTLGMVPRRPPGQTESAARGPPRPRSYTGARG